jgi:glycosyltransferase involved in cell wall biosynthesis
MPEVLRRVDCNLIVAGEFYEPIERYEEMIRQLGIGDAVRLENRYIPNEEVPRYFDEADVLVMPYVSATQSAVAGIAIANGLPIIASRTGGLNEIVRDGYDGLLVPPGDPKSLAEALIRYFEQGLGPVFSRNLRLNAQNDSQNEVALTIEQLSQP